MNPKTPTEAEPFLVPLLDSLTPREIAVLSRRFGIEPVDVSEAELEALALFEPPRGGSSGQGGAPVHAVTEVPTADNNEAGQIEIPGIKKTRT